MRIAFISANRETMPDAVLPLGVLHVMAATPERHEKQLWDLCFEDDPLATVERKLRSYQPDLVAIGLRNLQNMDYTSITGNVEAYRALFRTVRENSPAPIVVGGGGFSVAPKALMEDLGADYGIAGEGERAFVRFLEGLERSKPQFTSVERLYYRQDGQLLYHALYSLAEVLLGLAIGLITASSLGYLLAKSRLVERILSPYIVARSNNSRRNAKCCC